MTQTADTKIILDGGYLIITPLGYVNACVRKSGAWTHIDKDQPDPIAAGKAWVAMFKDCARMPRR